jgi:hypothetical protein
MARFRIVVEIPTCYEMVVQAPNEESLDKFIDGDCDEEYGLNEFLDSAFIPVESWEDSESLRIVEKRELKPRERASGTRVRINKKGEVVS